MPHSSRSTTRIARSLIETLRKGANPLDDRMLMVAKAHLAALVALVERGFDES